MQTPRTQQRGDRLREAVFAIADALLQEGQRPTINKIAQRLGHGSNTTIGDALEIWWSLLHSRLESAFHTPAIDSEIVDLTEDLWKRAVGKAAGQYQEEKTQLEQNLAALQEENTLLQAALQEQQDKLLSTEQALEQLLNEKTVWEEKNKILEATYQQQSQTLLKIQAEHQAALSEQQKQRHELSEKLQQQELAHRNALDEIHKKQQDELQNLAQQLKTATAEIIYWQDQVTFLKEFSEKQEALQQARYLEQKQNVTRLEQERRYLTKVISQLQKKSKMRRKIDPPDDFF